jgi:hypothetical protein
VGQILCHNGDTVESRSSREAIARLAVHLMLEATDRTAATRRKSKRAVGLPAAALRMLPAVSGKRSGPRPAAILPLPLHQAGVLARLDRHRAD